MTMTLDFDRPCKTHQIRDNFDDHVKRGSALPGLDYATAVGDDVFASADGTILSVSHVSNQARGMNIVVRHRDGRKSHYLHLSRILVGAGKRVRKGSVIARSGNSGTTTTGAHLHFSIMEKSGKCVDPAKVLRSEPKPPTSTPQLNKPKGPANKKIRVAVEQIPE